MKCGLPCMSQAPITLFTPAVPTNNAFQGDPVALTE